MGIDYGWEKFFNTLHYAVASVEPLQARLASVVSGVNHLERDSFPDDETFNEFKTMLKATTMVPAKGNEGTIQSTTSVMKDDEAAMWLRKAFDIFSGIAEAYGAHTAAGKLRRTKAVLSIGRPMSADVEVWRSGRCCKSLASAPFQLVLFQLHELTQ